jgi:hypothetical protein
LPSDHVDEVEKLLQKKTGVAYVSMSDKSFKAPDTVSESEARDLHETVKHRVETMRAQYPSEEDLKGVLVGMVRNPPNMEKIITEMKTRGFSDSEQSDSVS